jgi:hypothetical protein
MDTVLEIASPLREGQILEVRRDLNQLEELPHIFVNEARIRDMEIREAIAAFQQRRDYNPAAITPFAARLDQAIDINGYSMGIVEYGRRIPTEMLVNYSIWEAIYYMWHRDTKIFDVQRRRESEWIETIGSDRALRDPPTLPDHFVTAMERTLRTHGIPTPSEGVQPFARWVYESPTRCPGFRLAYEAQHRFRRNLTAKPCASDLIDLARVAAVPYVDFFVTDSEMMDYCQQAAREMRCPYPQLLGNFRTVLTHVSIL